MLLVERHVIKGTPEIKRLCETSRLLYNYCNYLMRQTWYKNYYTGSVERLPDINVLVQAVKDKSCYRDFGNTKIAKQTIRQVLTDWSNFKKALYAYSKDKSKFLRCPKPPKYKDKLAQIIFYNETISKKGLKQGLLISTNKYFTIKSDKNFKQVMATPKQNHFIIDVQYEVEEQKQTKGQGICCIDIGLNNLCAITSDQHAPIVVNGRIPKSVNQWYNKNTSPKCGKKRYWRLENYFHHVSKWIIDNCLKHNIGKIIIGKNDGWKQGMNLGKRVNQNFQSVPFYKLIQKIQYKAVLVGIQVVFTEESYTSKASFFDRDPLPAYEKDVKHSFSGKRVKRGLYVSKDGRMLNADINGSANIGRKVIKNEDIILRLDRSLAARPVVINPLKKVPA